MAERAAISLRIMATQNLGPSPKTVWTYAYQIVPPQAASRMGSIRNLLDREHADAQRGERTWVGRVVLERQITHILVVSDSPGQDHDVNRKLEAELKQLNVGFAITATMAASDVEPPKD